jgi:hypothetical protein
MTNLVTFLKHEPEGEIRIEIVIDPYEVHSVLTYTRGDDPITKILMHNGIEYLVYGNWSNTVDRLAAAMSKEDSTG